MFNNPKIKLIGEFKKERFYCTVCQFPLLTPEQGTSLKETSSGKPFLDLRAKTVHTLVVPTSIAAIKSEPVPIKP